MKLNLDCVLKVGLTESVYSLHTFNPKRKVYSHICKDGLWKENIYFHTKKRRMYTLAGYFFQFILRLQHLQCVKTKGREQKEEDKIITSPF